MISLSLLSDDSSEEEFQLEHQKQLQEIMEA